MINKLIELTGEIDSLKIENHKLKKERLIQGVIISNCRGLCSVCVSKLICPFVRFVHPVSIRNKVIGVISLLILFSPN